jgi:hypothetical protein
MNAASCILEHLPAVPLDSRRANHVATWQVKPRPLRAALDAADDRALTSRAATRRKHQPPRGGDLPRARRAGRREDQTAGLQQPQRLGDQVGPVLPRRGARSGDLTGADGLSVLVVLGVSQRCEHDSLLGGHRHRNLAVRRGARNRDATTALPVVK